MVPHHHCSSPEFWPIVAGSSSVSMPSDRFELVDDAPQRGLGPVRSSPSDLHCSKKPRTSSTATQEGPMVPSPGASSHKLNTGSHKKAIELPTGVVNIFPSSNDQSKCCCPTQPQRTTLASCDVAQVFVSQYGADNLAYLQERERREFPSKSPTCNRAPMTSLAPSNLSSSAQTSKEEAIDSKLAGYVSPPSGGLSDAKFLPPSWGPTSAKFLENWSDHLPKQPWVTTRMRAIIVSWLVEVTAELNISEEAFHVAITILDRVFRSGATKEQYQANLDYDWDADFFCVRTCELQALGWYVFAFEGRGVSSCQD